MNVFPVHAPDNSGCVWAANTECSAESRHVGFSGGCPRPNSKNISDSQAGHPVHDSNGCSVGASVLSVCLARRRAASPLGVHIGNVVGVSPVFEMRRVTTRSIVTGLMANNRLFGINRTVLDHPCYAMRPLGTVPKSAVPLVVNNSGPRPTRIGATGSIHLRQKAGNRAIIEDKHPNLHSGGPTDVSASCRHLCVGHNYSMFGKIL